MAAANFEIINKQNTQPDREVELKPATLHSCGANVNAKQEKIPHAHLDEQ